MVLAELGSRITNALRNVGSKAIIDKEAVDAMLKEVGLQLCPVGRGRESALTRGGWLFRLETRWLQPT